MRIIGGSAKGKNLFSPSDKTRPTSDRAREGLFSSLESEFGSMRDLAFLDLFAGSGAVCVEALSRGANLVVAVESHQPTTKIIEKNFNLVNQASGKYEVENLDVMKFVASPNNNFDIIFIDPPYELENKSIEKILREIAVNNLLKPNGIIAIERDSKSKEFIWPAPFAQTKVRSYGQGSIYYGGYSASVSL